MYNITNSTNIDEILVNLSSNVPSLFPMLLFFEFIVIAVGGAFANSRRTGFTNISQWSAIAGLVTTTTGFILFLVNGLISLYTLGLLCAITFFCVLWFFSTGDEQ